MTPARKDAQPTIPFEFSTYRAILTDSELPTVKTKNGTVSAHTMKAILLALWAFGGSNGKCVYRSFASLALATGFSERNVKRGVEALQTLNVLLVECRPTPRGARCNHYTILFTDLDAFRKRANDSTCDTNASRSDTEVRRRDFHVKQSDTNAAESDTMSPEVLEDNQKPPPKANGGGIVESWDATEKTLTEFGIRTAPAIVQQARQRGENPADFAATVRDAIATARLKANASVFKDPAAAVAILLTRGSWPEAPEKIQTLDQRQKHERRQEQNDMERTRRVWFTDVIREGRRAGQSEEQIYRVLAEKLPGEWLEAQGWKQPCATMTDLVQEPAT